MPWRTVYDKVLPHKAFIVAKNPEYSGYQCVFVSMFYRSFDNQRTLDLTGIAKVSDCTR